MSDMKMRRSSAPNPSTSPKRPLYPRFVTMPELAAPSSGRAGDMRRRSKSPHSRNVMGDNYCRADRTDSPSSSASPKRSWSPRCSTTDRLPLAASRLLAETDEEPIPVPVEEPEIQVEKIIHVATRTHSCKSSVKRTCRNILRRCSNLIAM